MHLRSRAGRAFAGSVVRHPLHPRTRSRRSVSATAGASSTTTGRITARLADAVQRVLRRRGPVRQPVGRLLVLARRIRADPAARVHRLGSGVHAARDCEGRSVVRRLLPRLRSSVHLRRQHRHARVRRADRGVHLAQDVAAGRDRSLAYRDAADRRPVHHRDDVEDRELHRRGRQQGSRVPPVPRPSRSDAPSVRARDQRSGEPAARARLAHRRRHERVAVALGLSRVHSGLEGGIRRRQACVRVAAVGMVQRPDRVLSGRRASGARAGHGVERAPARGHRTDRLLDARGGARRARSHRRDYALHARRAGEIAREYFDASRVLPRLLETACA